MKNKETRKKIKKALDDAREIFRVTALSLSEEDRDDFEKNENFDPGDELLKTEFSLLGNINTTGYIKFFTDTLRIYADQLDERTQKCLEKYFEDRKIELKRRGK